MTFRGILTTGLIVALVGACAVERKRDNDDDDGFGFGGAGGASSASTTGSSMNTSSTTGSMNTSSTTGSMNTSSTTSSAMGCDTGVPDSINGPTCQACLDCAVQSDCVNELNACQNSADCVNFVGCAQSCSDQPCLDGCVSSYPTGAQLYNNLLSCGVCVACPINCDAATNCG